jgi:hypothetical protein
LDPGSYCLLPGSLKQPWTWSSWLWLVCQAILPTAAQSPSDSKLCHLDAFHCPESTIAALQGRDLSTLVSSSAPTFPVCSPYLDGASFTLKSLLILSFLPGQFQSEQSKPNPGEPIALYLFCRNQVIPLSFLSSSEFSPGWHLPTEFLPL